MSIELNLSIQDFISLIRWFILLLLFRFYKFFYWSLFYQKIQLKVRTLFQLAEFRISHCRNGQTKLIFAEKPRYEIFPIIIYVEHFYISLFFLFKISNLLRWSINFVFLKICFYTFKLQKSNILIIFYNSFITNHYKQYKIIEKNTIFTVSN